MIELYLRIIAPLVLVLLAGFFLFIALKTLVGRRPLIISARWLFGMICLGFLPSLMTPFVFGVSRQTAMLVWLTPAMLIVTLIFIWIQMRGFMAFAVSDVYFREALLSSAAKLGYTVEETMSCLKIKETGHEIQVSIQGWMGTAQFKPKNRGSTDVVKRIAEGMTQHFSQQRGKMKYVTSYFYAIMGSLLIFFAIVMSVVAKGIHLPSTLKVIGLS